MYQVTIQLPGGAKITHNATTKAKALNLARAFAPSAKFIEVYSVRAMRVIYGVAKAEG